MTTNLVVADLTRTEKTICLAVTPALKAYGILGRARLFEVIQKVREINAQRRQRVPSHVFSGSSSNDLELRANPALELDYIVAPPRMARYMEWSARHISGVPPPCGAGRYPPLFHRRRCSWTSRPIFKLPAWAPWEFAKRVSKMYLTPLELPPPRDRSQPLPLQSCAGHRLQTYPTG